ncbi:GNAT family N-acetyltransferase [Polaribacter gangjinensis]|uniref:GNAT family N-acetyltransferase n=1 Tax=Polaribacter gangjinensis TaxID=574710 RepID=A0A2S7WEE2_9FLAO|nr:GNAT family N-acetyltransferase [Polaribacter gangjinensis]PQJ75622.1 GNAT family N-acetyltransferase [Polaribacter gangjinensis]
MSFIIRKGQPKDAQAILDLIIELAVFEKEPNAVEITKEDLLNDGFSDNPKFKLFVAEENEIIIGMALFYERYSTWKGKTIHLEDLIVTHQKRNLGVGKALYTAVLKYAFDHNYNRVAWEVLDWNTNAIEFYKSTGATYLSGWHVVQMNKENLAKFIQK